MQSSRPQRDDFFIYIAIMKNTVYLYLFALLILCSNALAQNDSSFYARNAVKAVRTKEYSNLINNSITKNLSRPLTDATEENWMDAFMAIELTTYRSAWVDSRIKQAFDSVEKRSVEFQRALLEMAYSNYHGKFIDVAERLMKKTSSPRIFAIAAEHYLAGVQDPNAWNNVIKYFSKRPDKDDQLAPYYGLLTGLISGYSAKKDLAWLVSNLKTAVPGQVLLISFQRKNRNQPGLALVRDKNGNFIKNENGGIFSVPQLARSLSNLPFYLTNGNTPQGIFRMNGFDISKSMAIGPTTNIQLLMPYETSPQHFLNDPSVTDSVWTEDVYKKLIPESLKEYLPLYETFFASKAGRTEIIAHGTTVNPAYYLNQPYYPLTPTQGCLCTKELWSDQDGKRTLSDQQKLVDAIKKAGGANGYCIVIEIDDQQKPVSLNEVLAYLK